jgi:hypothetical protein
MISAEFIDGRSLIIFGLAVVAFVFVLRRIFLRVHSAHRRHDQADAGEDFEAAEAGALRATEMLEVRLFDFAREVEGRMASRMAVLDRLIVDADREILRLQDVLAQTRGQTPLTHGEGSASSAHSKIAPGQHRQPDAVIAPPSDAEFDRKEAA